MRFHKSLIFLSGFLIGTFMIGCSAPKKQCSAAFCHKGVVKRTVIKKIKISECPRRIKTVVYNDICSKCKYPVSVRENNCCSKGGCR